MTALLAAVAAGAAVVLAAGGAHPPPRRPPGLDAPVRRRPAPVTALGRTCRRLLGGRPDPRLDRWTGAAVLGAAAAALVGPAPVAAALGGTALAGRWRRLRSTAGVRPDVARDLPDLVDLLGLAVGAGLAVPAALPAVAPLAPASLRPDLAHAAAALAGGQPSDEVVVELGRRWGPPARPLVHALADHLRYGTPVLPAIERVAADARTSRRRAAETRARRLPVLLLFPLVLCTLPAFGLLTVAPLVAGTFDSLRGGHLEAPASNAAHP